MSDRGINRGGAVGVLVNRFGDDRSLGAAYVGVRLKIGVSVQDKSVVLTLSSILFHGPLRGPGILSAIRRAHYQV